MSVHGEKAAEILCPSARCEKDAILLGVLDASGRLGYIRPALKVDDDFVAGAAEGRTPEERFRFAQPCVESGCRNWTGERCAVIDDALAFGAAAESLPVCSIRRACRWFAQAGPSACAVCPLIVRNVKTDMKGDSVMPEANDEKVSKGRTTLSTEGRKILGESILNGIIAPGEVIAGSLDYNQHGGNYTQRGGGNYSQSGGGNYDQARLV